MIVWTFLLLLIFNFIVINMFVVTLKKEISSKVELSKKLDAQLKSKDEELTTSKEDFQSLKEQMEELASKHSSTISQMIAKHAKVLPFICCPFKEFLSSTKLLSALFLLVFLFPFLLLLTSGLFCRS